MGHSFDNRVSHRHDGDHFPGHPSTAKRDHLDLGREFAWTRASARAEMGLAHTESWIGVSATFSDADPDSNQQNHQTAHHLLALHRELSWQIPRTKIGIMAHLPNGTKAPIAKLCATFDSVEVVETETQLFQSLCAADSWILIETPSCPESIVLAEALIDVADSSPGLCQPNSCKSNTGKPQSGEAAKLASIAKVFIRRQRRASISDCGCTCSPK